MHLLTQMSEGSNQAVQSLVREFQFPDSKSAVRATPLDFNPFKEILSGIKRRFARERCRRKVGRAYDMAREIAQVVPRGSKVLDVGCGSGFITHHLSAILGAGVIGLDLMSSPEAPIDYRRYDGAKFPVPDKSRDAVLFCYVLHHAPDAEAILKEAQRVLRDNGTVVVYEDLPLTFWDKVLCSIHDYKWKNRTGICTFRMEAEWRALFKRLGFEIRSGRKLSRWRNFTHPVTRSFFVLQAQPAAAIAAVSPRPWIHKG